MQRHKMGEMNIQQRKVNKERQRPESACSAESSALHLQTRQVGGGCQFPNGGLCLSTHQINQNKLPTEEVDRAGQSSHTRASILINSYWRGWGLSLPIGCTHAHTHGTDAHSCCLAWVLYTDPNKLACGRACLSLSQVNDVINDCVAAWMGAGVLAFKHLFS